MKKLGLMFVMAGVISFGLSSCGDDTTDTPSLPKPTVSFLAGTGIVSSSGTQPAGGLVTFSIDVTGANNLKEVKAMVSIDGGTQSTFADSLISGKQKNFKWILDYSLPNSPNAKVVFTFQATMEDGQPGSNTLTITTSAAPKALGERKNISIGAQSNPTYGSFINFDSLAIKFKGEADGMSGKNIDAVYYYGTTNQNAIVAPDDATANTFFASVSTWGTRKKTRFLNKAFTAAEFDAMTMSTDIDNKLANATATSATKLAVGDVILFKTEGTTTYGIMKVVSVASANNGELVFDVKIPN